MSARCVVLAILACAAPCAPALAAAPSEPPFHAALWSGSRGVVGADLAGSPPSFTLGPLDLQLRSQAAGTREGQGLARLRLANEVRLELASPALGVWAGLASEQRTQLDSSFPVVSGGVWAANGGVEASTTFQQREALVTRDSSDHLPFIPPPYDIGPSSVHLIWVESALRWGEGRWDFGVRGGAALDARVRPAQWGRVDAAYALMPHLALAAAYVGATPRWAALDLVERAHLQLGVRLDPAALTSLARPRVRAGASGPGGWRLRPLDHGASELAVMVRGARRVELRGDITGWESVTLLRAASDWWSVRLPIASGPHEVEIRVDGGDWQPPPGMPTSEGEYGGRVGVFVLER